MPVIRIEMFKRTQEQKKAKNSQTFVRSKGGN